MPINVIHGTIVSMNEDYIDGSVDVLSEIAVIMSRYNHTKPETAVDILHDINSYSARKAESLKNSNK